MKRPLALLLALLGIHTACSRTNYENTDPDGFSDLLNRHNAVILDVRTPEEYAQGHIDGALNINVSDDGFLTAANAQLPPQATIAVYCRSGKRSAHAARLLADNGYSVVNLVGGIIAWTGNGLPTTTDTHEVDIFSGKSGKLLRFHALMHASIRLVYDGKEIAIDPVRQLGDRRVDYSAIPKADYVIVTHEHHDHFDPEAIRAVCKADTRLITNRRCADMLGYGHVMANGDTTVIDDITIEAVPAYNTTEAHLQFHPKGRDNGFVMTIDGLRIYIAGDTEDIPEMALLGDIDIAFLPCNQPYTMTTGQLLRAAGIIRPKVLFPYHYGQTDLADIPRHAPQGIDVRIRHYE